MYSTSATAHHGTGPWAQENWDAFGSGCLPWSSSNFPISADCATEDTPLSTSSYMSAPSPPESGVLDACHTKAAEHPRNVTGLQEQHPCAPSQPPRTPRPIVLIHSPRELLAYRNARPPVYVHHHCCGDNLHSHHNSFPPSFTRDSCDNCLDIHFDHSACPGCSPSSSKFAPPCASVGGQKYVTATDCSASTVGSVFQGDFTVGTHNVKADERASLEGDSCNSVPSAPENEYPIEQATEKKVSSLNSHPIREGCPALRVQNTSKGGLRDTCLSTRQRGYDSQSHYIRRRRISLVPTLGGLHEGHLHLMRQAACLSDEVWVSIFLNPLQFQSSKDFLSYPASIDEDIRLVQQLGVVSVLFVPHREALFPLDAPLGFSASPGVTSASASSEHGIRAGHLTACGERKESTSEQGREAASQDSETLVSVPAAAAACHKTAAAVGDSAGTVTPSVKLEGSSELFLQGNDRDRLPSKVAATLGSVVYDKASPARSVLTATSTPTAEESSAHEKGNSGRRRQQEKPNSSGSSRLFRMRVFFKDIEDVQGEGRRRRGFFEGVGTVVAQLLTLTRPTYLHVGLKDFQQVICLKRLVCGLGLDVLVVAHSTKRHASDGLSLSSRNKRLSGAERTAAAKYYSVLQQVCRSYERGERRVQQLETEARLHAAAAGVHLYYITFNRWQDGTPVAYTSGSSSTRKTPSCCPVTSNTTDSVAPASSSSLGAKQQEHTRQQEQPTQQQLARRKEDAEAQTSRLQPEGEANHERRVDGCEQQQEDNEGVEERLLESPGKYCCTVAVRGNADTTLVDSATLTDQPQCGDLLPPPLNVPWDRNSAAAKHSFFGSFLVLASLGMHLRYLNEDDVDLLLQAEEEDMEPRQDGPRLLLPPLSPAVGATAACQRQTEGEKNLGCSTRQQPVAAAGPGSEARESLLQQQQQRIGVCEGTRVTRGERMHILRWLQQQRRTLFEVEAAGTRKTLWMKKQEDTAAAGAAEQSCVRPCAQQVHSPATSGSGSTFRNSSNVCRVRAMGLFKYDLMDECSSSSNGTARLTSHCSDRAALEAGRICVASHGGADTSIQSKDTRRREGRHVAAVGDASANRTALHSGGRTLAERDTCLSGAADRCSDSGNPRETTAKSGRFKRRERLIGYVWAEEYAGEEQGGPPQKRERKEGCSASGNVCSVLRVKRVFLKRERRRQTLGTHLLRAFIAATYKQLLEEQQQAVSVASRHHRPPSAPVLHQGQQQEADLKTAGHTGPTVKGRPQECEDREAVVCKIRRTEEEQEMQEDAITEATETRKSRERGKLKMLCVEGETESTLEGGATEGKEWKESKHEMEGEISCTVQLENVPHYLVGVLREGGFCVDTAAAETTRAQTYKGSCCCMHVSLAQWYNAFVLNANV